MLYSAFSFFYYYFYFARCENVAVENGLLFTDTRRATADYRFRVPRRNFPLSSLIPLLCLITERSFQSKNRSGSELSLCRQNAFECLHFLSNRANPALQASRK